MFPSNKTTEPDNNYSLPKKKASPGSWKCLESATIWLKTIISYLLGILTKWI